MCIRDRTGAGLAGDATTGKAALMATIATPPDSGAETIDLARVASAMWRHRWMAVVMLAIALLGGILYLNRATYRYEASVILTPAEQTSALSTDGLQNLSAIVGVELSPQSGTGFALFREAAESLPVAQALARDERIMTTVFAHMRDKETGAWREPESLAGNLRKLLRRVSGAPVAEFRPPGAEELQIFLRRSVAISPDRRRAMTVVRFEHPDPEFARYLVGRLIDESDDFLRAKSLARSTDYVAYLEARLGQVQIAEHRGALAQALSSYEMMRMMASSEVPFTAEPFGEIMVTLEPTSPRPTMVYALALFLGLLAWGAYVFIREVMWPRTAPLLHEDGSIASR
jgi:hypothetical protein